MIIEVDCNCFMRMEVDDKYEKLLLTIDEEERIQLGEELVELFLEEKDVTGYNEIEIRKWVDGKPFMYFHE